MTIGRTLVLQSHRRPLPASWLAPCLDSVRAWAAGNGYAYRFEGDEFFARLDPDLRERTSRQPVIAADLARLAAIGEALVEDFETVVWVDADTLVFAPERLKLSPDSYALGREVWVQPHHGGVRTFVKVHNAFLLFRRGNPFLDFYRHAAERIVRDHRGRHRVPQLVGPKLLTALHNLAGCPVMEPAGVLSPLVARDVLTGRGPALEAFRSGSTVAPASVNLCASLVGRDISEAEVGAVIDRLLQSDVPGALQGP